jgi:hypothetical protein
MHAKQSYILLFTILLYSIHLNAQKLFVEGVIIYEVTFKTNDPLAGNTEYRGTYTITVKEKQVRKEMRMNNGYDDVVVYDNNSNTAFSLKTVYGKKYAIQLNPDDYMDTITKFGGFTISDEDETKKIAGVSARKAVLTYTDGSTCNLYYTSEWAPADKFMFEHFPQIKYLPIVFTYTQNGIIMHFKATRIESEPVESSLFKIPPDYQIMSYAEYKQMGK